VLWLNGGPGCSSLDGFLYEHGPFRMNESDPTQLVPFEWTWAKQANMLYLESPVGVGFSYSDAPLKDYKCTDDTAAEDNLNAVENFFKKFPELKKNDLFITGESCMEHSYSSPALTAVTKLAQSPLVSRSPLPVPGATHYRSRYIVPHVQRGRGRPQGMHERVSQLVRRDCSSCVASDRGRSKIEEAKKGGKKRRYSLRIGLQSTLCGLRGEDDVDTILTHDGHVTRTSAAVTAG